MTDSLPDTWYCRDLPVLREVARQLAAGDRAPMPSQIAQALDMTIDEVTLAGLNLRRGGLVRVNGSYGSQVDFFEDVSDEALRLVGMWPTPESTLDRMIAALEQIAANTDDEDTRTRSQRFADWLKGAGSTVGLTVAAAAITGQLPR